MFYKYRAIACKKFFYPGIEIGGFGGAHVPPKPPKNTRQV
jgi:hypothetical protein